MAQVDQDLGLDAGLSFFSVLGRRQLMLTFNVSTSAVRLPSKWTASTMYEASFFPAVCH